MKAISKRDCNVVLYVDMNAVSLNNVMVEKGGEVTGEVHKDKPIHTSVLKEFLGDRCVIFFNEGYYIPCFSNDFEFVEE